MKLKKTDAIPKITISLLFVFSSMSFAVFVGEEVSVMGGDINFNLDVDRKGNVHLVAKTFGWTGIKYCFKPFDGSWGQVQDIPIGSFPLGVFSWPDVAGDNQGNAHIVWSDGSNDRIWYTNNIGGQWKEPLMIASIYGPEYADTSSPQIAIDAVGRIHVAYMRCVGDRWSAESTYSYDGIYWSSEQHIMRIGDSQFPSIWPDNYGNIHAGVLAHSSVFFNHWSQEICDWVGGGQLVNDDAPVDKFYISATGSGNPIIAWQPYTCEPYCYLLEARWVMRLPNGEWTEPIIASNYGHYIEEPNWWPLPRAVAPTDEEVFIFYAYRPEGIFYTRFLNGQLAEMAKEVGYSTASIIDADFYLDYINIVYYANGIIKNREIRSDTKYIPHTPNPPKILAGGYWNTRLEVATDTTIAANLRMIAIIPPQDTVSVGAVYNNPFLFMPLYDDGKHGDLGSNDGVWGFQIPIQLTPNTPPIRLTNPLTIMAVNSYSEISDPWPFLVVKD